MDSGDREPAPPSSSARRLESVRGVEVIVSSRDPHPASRLTISEAPPDPPRKKARTPSSRRKLIVAGAMAAVGVAAIAGWFAWSHRPYIRGTVLHHLGEGCVSISYIDFAAIERSTVVDQLGAARLRAVVDWAEDADEDDGIRRSKDEDAKGRASAIRALLRGGVHPFGDVREFARCALPKSEKGEGEDQVMLLGGSFRGQPLDTFAQAYRRRFHLRENEVVVEEIAGRATLSLPTGRVMAMATPSLMIVGPRKAVRARFEETPSPMTRLDDVIIAHMRSRKGDDDEAESNETEDRATIVNGALGVVRIEPREKRTRRAIEESLRAPNEALHKIDRHFDAIVDAYTQADIAMPDDDDADTEGRVTTTVTLRLDDLVHVERALLDLDTKRVRRAVPLLLRTPVGLASLSFVTPSVELAGLQLVPWTASKPEEHDDAHER